MKRNLLFTAIISLVLANVVFAETKVVNPRTNGRVEPVGINEDRIVLSWNLDDPTPDTMQTAYRITVKDLWDKDLWDSGWVKSSQCIEIPYKGKQLRSSTKYSWTVQVKNNRGEIAQLKSQASFTTGIIRPGDWKAMWISMDRTDQDPLPIFRKSFEIDPAKKIEHAIVHICGLGHFELNLNGEKLGDHFIDPGWTNYRKTCLYVSFDLTDSLQPGENVFGVLLGNGMYNVPGGRYVKFTGSFGPPKMICQLYVKYTDGSEQFVVSDDTWKASLGPIVFSCVYGGEDVDNRRVEPGWDKPGFDDTNWKNV
ncbi:MAG: alpha-L-rhamnosidase N-terminal domain-containing protein, partial [Planctomycetaceae bacterium]|nr:alpha-L-rhamnosidase N-terminal domain-containing protein [Planctomycetaceae bacterium]